jgi:RimJ/RimL family protein N-acetyltransferase
LLAQLRARARTLGAEVVRAYAPAGDHAWSALARRHDLREVERDRYLVLELDQATTAPGAGPEVHALATEPGEAEREAWQLEQRLHEALETCARYVPETFEQWRARVLAAPGCGRETVLVSRAPGGELGGICALRVCVAEPRAAYHAFTGVAAEVRGRGHGLALKQAAIACARGLGAHRLIADTSPANSAMLTLNERLGYRAALDVRNLEGRP